MRYEKCTADAAYLMFADAAYLIFADAAYLHWYDIRNV